MGFPVLNILHEAKQTMYLYISNILYINIYIVILLTYLASLQVELKQAELNTMLNSDKLDTINGLESTAEYTGLYLNL